MVLDKSWAVNFHKFCSKSSLNLAERDFLALKYLCPLARRLVELVQQVIPVASLVKVFSLLLYYVTHVK